MMAIKSVGRLLFGFSLSGIKSGNRDLLRVCAMFSPAHCKDAQPISPSSLSLVLIRAVPAGAAWTAPNCMKFVITSV
jgi:hypothetical protein